jgi:hypothetical protein
MVGYMELRVAWSYGKRWRDAGAYEIVALEQQRLAPRARQGVSEAIAEI